MNSLTLIGFLILFITVISALSVELGITNPAIVPIAEPVQPDTSGVIRALINIATTAINLIWSFVQIMTYQVQGIPTALNTFIMVPLTFLIGYVFIRVIRGGG